MGNTSQANCIVVYVEINSFNLNAYITKKNFSQSDNLLSYLTVEETLTYTAQLALRKHSSEAIRKKVSSFPSQIFDRYEKRWTLRSNK